MLNDAYIPKRTATLPSRSSRNQIAAALVAIGLVAANAGPVPALAAPVHAKSADSFVDTIGVGLHVSYTRTAYWGQWPQVKAALLELGVRHFRDGIADCSASASKAFCRHFQELGDAGIRGNFATGLKLPMSVVTAFPAAIPGAFDSFEGPNEVDINGDPNWLADVAAYQQLLYTTVKANPATAQYPVIGPAIGHIANYAKTRDLSAFFDYGNLHDYLGPINPGTHSDGRIQNWIQSARNFNSTKPDITTETGYWDGPPGKGLPDAIIARYEPRLFLEQYEAGIVRTYQYEFIDEGTDLDGIYTHAGLLDRDLAPKPQYTALKSLIAALRDPGPAFTPATLDYELSGQTDHVDEVLFAKRDGSKYLALWLEKSSYNVAQQRELTVARQHVMLTVHGSVDRATTLTFDDAGTTTRAPLTFTAHSTTLTVGDHVIIVELPPR